MSENKSENKSDRQFNRFFGAVIIAQISLAVVGISLLAGVAYVACHFLAKIW